MQDRNHQDQEYLDPSLRTPEEVRQLAKQFMRRTGMAPADFARRVGYHYATVTQFLRNKYRRGEGSKEHFICEAILRFLGANYGTVSGEKFDGKLYEIGNVRKMREVFQRLCDERCILMTYAPPGSGKTDVARALIPQYAKTGVEIFRIYCRFGITKRDIMRRIAIRCGSVADIGIERTLDNLRFDYAGKRVALYFDEAQHLSIDCLETVRELYDELQWSLCFAGSHQIDQMFTKWIGNLEQLESRIIDKITLPDVTFGEAESIVHTELPGLTPAKAHKLIEQSYVDIRSDGEIQRYLSIRRLMDQIREIQKMRPEFVDARPIPVQNLENPSEEIA